jgi:hypothetical protein
MAKPQFPIEVQQMEFPRGESVSFDVQAFDDAVAAHGPTFVHWQAMPDPIGLQGKFDSRRPDGVNNTNSFNGWYYVKMGELQAVLSGSTKEAKASAGGIVDAGIAQITPSTRYLCSSIEIPRRVYLSPFDRFYLKDESIVVPRGELVEASITGIDKTAFPCEQVLAIVDADGIEYGPQDYTIVSGMIKWNSHRPSYNVEVGKGKVYSVKYLLKPFFYVHRLVHELRLMQIIDPGTGERKVVQANQSAIVQREYLFQNKVVDATAQDTAGAIPAPTE